LLKVIVILKEKIYRVLSRLRWLTVCGIEIQKDKRLARAWRVSLSYMCRRCPLALITWSTVAVSPRLETLISLLPKNQWLLRVNYYLDIASSTVHSLVLLLKLNCIVQSFNTVFDRKILFLTRVLGELTWQNHCKWRIYRLRCQFYLLLSYRNLFKWWLRNHIVWWSTILNLRSSLRRQEHFWFLKGGNYWFNTLICRVQCLLQKKVTLVLSDGRFEYGWRHQVEFFIDWTILLPGSFDLFLAASNNRSTLRSWRACLSLVFFRFQNLLDHF
jgi:hypothetical protein